MTLRRDSRRDFTRARRPEEVAQRRGDLLAAANRLLEKESVDKISLNGIAREAGIAKSAVYRYFESREAIFLEMLEGDWRDWVDETEYQLSRLGEVADPREIAYVLVTSTVARPRLCLLLSVLAAVLEHNLSEEVVAGFKQESIQLGMRISRAVHALLPEAEMEDVTHLMHGFVALVAGLWPLSHPSKVVRKVIARPGFAPYRPDFERDLRFMTETLVAGLQVSR